MKIVALTDVHGAYDLAATIIEAEKPDAVIVGGDLTTVGSVREAAEAIERFQQLCAGLYCVAGNMDLPAHDAMHVKLGISLNGRGAIAGDVGFFGASGAPFSPLHTPYEIAEEEIGERLRRGYEDVRHCAMKILVPHAPPYGTHVDIIHSGIHVGSIAVREFIEDFQPEAVICGHIHEARGQDILGASRIVNCGAAMNGYYARLDIGTAVTILNLHHPV